MPNPGHPPAITDYAKRNAQLPQVRGAHAGHRSPPRPTGRPVMRATKGCPATNLRFPGVRLSRPSTAARDKRRDIIVHFRVLPILVLPILTTGSTHLLEQELGAATRDRTFCDVWGKLGCGCQLY